MRAMRSGSKNAGLFLEPADVFHDVIDLLGFHCIDLRHVAELPMMSLDAIGRRSLKRRVAVMIRLIDFVDERWTLSGSDSADPMAG